MITDFKEIEHSALELDENNRAELAEKLIDSLDQQTELNEREIRDVHSTWVDAVNAGDLVRLLALMTDDVVFLNPGQEPFGRDEFSANFSAAHQQDRIRCNSELEEALRSSPRRVIFVLSCKNTTNSA